MKKRTRTSLLLLAVAVAVAIGSRYAATDGAPSVRIANGTAAESDAGAALVRVAVSKEQPYRGNLVLVNKEHAIRKDGVRTDIVALAERPDLLAGAILLAADIRMSEDVMRRFADMAEAARADGIDRFVVSSGYRTHAEQDALYAERGAAYALPAGHSEHQLGIALDIGSTAGEMAEAEEGRWLARNAWRFGFVLRYPAHKTDITGIRFEPWHFRYVGLPHSAVMQERDLTLEEYLDLLAEKRQLSVSVGGKTYGVRYEPYAPGMTVSVPEDRPYTLSGDNKGGIIVTSGG